MRETTAPDLPAYLDFENTFCKKLPLPPGGEDRSVRVSEMVAHRFADNL